jgi:uncharacterized protein
MRLFLQRFSLFFLCWLIVLMLLDGCVQFRKSTSEMELFFENNKIPGKIRIYTAHQRQIRYAEVGSDIQNATVLFIHGAPSSMSYFNSYLADARLQAQARMFAVDRPGYGYSGFGKPEPSIEKQAAMIKVILDSLHRVRRPVVVVGTSYGTSIACRLTMDYPNLVDGLVLVAPALAPGEEKIYPVSYPAELPFIKWMVPRMLQSANAEKLSHRRELTQMLPLWKNIRVPVIYIQGEKDELVYTTNAGFARKNLKHVPSLEIILIKDKGHLIAFSEKDTIEDAILRMLELTKSRQAAGK